MVQIVGILCKHEHVHIHTRTPRNTTLLHHPSTHSDKTLTKNTTNHSISVYIWISLATVCFYLSRISACTESLLVWGRGSSWSTLDLETLESDVSSGKTAGCDRQGVRQRVAAIKRGDPSPRYVGGSPRRLTPEHMREFQ